MKPVHTAEYLAAFKKKVGISSDYALAQHLGVSRQAVSQWQSGTHFPDNNVCWQISEALALPLSTVVASIELERAVRAGKALQEVAWKERLSRIGATTFAAFFAVLLSAFPDGSAQAKAPLAADSANSQSANSQAIHCRYIHVEQRQQ